MDDENHELIPINEPDNINNEKTSSISKEKKYSQYYDENAEKKNFTNISNLLKSHQSQFLENKQRFTIVIYLFHTE